MTKLLSCRVRRIAMWTLAAGMIAAMSPPARAAEVALCAVCAVTEGARTAEPVKEWRTHGGTRYALCSEKCAQTFDAEPAAYVSPVFPRPAPDLGLPSLAGDTLTWERLRGNVVLVDFWATWCAPCRKSMPELQALYESHGARGFTVIGVSIDEAAAAKKVHRFVDSKRIRYPIGLDAGKAPAWQRYGVRAIPAAYLVDGEGRIVAQWTGAPPDLKELEERLEGLLPTVETGHP